MKKMTKQSGVTLLELLMVVGIAAVIAVSALVFFRTTDESNKVSLEAKNLGTLASGIANMFAAQGNYAGLNNSVLRASNVLPDNMVGGGATDISHSWSSTGVTAAAVTLLSPNDGFTISYTAVPQKSCVDLATKTMSSFQALAINGQVVTNVGEISTECQSSASATMLWTR